MLKGGLLSKPKALKVVDRVSFSIEKGHAMGLVGESGRGKATVGRTVLELYQAATGWILYQGTGITELSDNQMVPYRKRMQMISQDPYTSLDPKKNTGDITAEPIWAMKLYTGKDKNDRVRELIEMADLKPNHINRYPREFSGEQKQKIDITKALAAEPEFIARDESVSALDVSIQAQVISILEELQDRFHFTCLFISYSLSMVHHISSEVGVMYLGGLIEYAQVDELHGNVFRPYTQSLVSAVPVADPKLVREDKRIILEGDVPSPINPAPSCPFRSKCRYTKGICSQARSEPKTVNDEHKVACHLFDQANGAGLT